MKASYQVRPSLGPRVIRVAEQLASRSIHRGTTGLGSETKNSRANLTGRVQNGSVYYAGIDVFQTKNTSTNNAGSGFALGSTTSSHTVGATQTIESRGGNSGSWYGSKLESGNSTTHYTTVTGTMGQPFSGMTQTGFNTTTLYGTAAQTGISGAYGSTPYGQTETGGSYNTLQTGGNSAASWPLDLPPINTQKPDQIIDLEEFNYEISLRKTTNEERWKIRIINMSIRIADARKQNGFFLGWYRSHEEKQRDEILGVINLENIQTGIDIVGMAPVVGEIADGLNAGMYLVQGRYVEAGLSFAAIIPGVGILSVSGRMGKKLLNLEEAVLAKTKQIERLTEMGGMITDANGAVKHTIKPVVAAENVEKGIVLRTKPDSFKQHILNRELNAARREAAGEVVARKANGQPFDHVTELRDAQNGLLKRIRNIKKDLENPTLDIGTRIDLERELSEASKLLDKTEEFLPR